MDKLNFQLLNELNIINSVDSMLQFRSIPPPETFGSCRSCAKCEKY